MHVNPFNLTNTIYKPFNASYYFTDLVNLKYLNFFLNNRL